MPVHRSDKSVRLHLGSGPIAVPGWVNIDRSPNLLLDKLPTLKRLLGRTGLIDDQQLRPWSRDILRHDIRSMPFPDGIAEAIYSSHTLEHLYIVDAARVIHECRRLLEPGGVLRIALPDALHLAQRLIDDRNSCMSGWEYNRRLLAHPESRPSLIRRLVVSAGGHVHRWQPTAAMVEDMLCQAGFDTVTQWGYREGKLPDLDIIETRPESFFLEATHGS
jgi:SAM-dependent methyltransferase